MFGQEWWSQRMVRPLLFEVGGRAAEVHHVHYMHAIRWHGWSYFRIEQKRNYRIQASQQPLCYMRHNFGENSVPGLYLSFIGQSQKARIRYIRRSVPFQLLLSLDLLY